MISKLKVFIQEASAHTWKQVSFFALVWTLSSIAMFAILMFAMHENVWQYMPLAIVFAIVFTLLYATFLIWEERKDIKSAAYVGAVLSEYGLTIGMTEDGYFDISNESNDEYVATHLNSEEITIFMNGVKTGYSITGQKKESE